MVDYGLSMITMEEVSISTFKATCLAVLERVRRTGQPILITRRGRPIAEVFPPSPAPAGKPWLGSGSHTGRIEGDLVEPVADGDEWDAVSR